jgi:hypothetical protein
VKASRKVRTPQQEAGRVAKSIGLSPEQILHGIAVHDVSNRTEAQQRHSIRSGETRTVRKLTRIDKLKASGTISRDEAQACEWYAAAHALGYDTLGITANYGGSGSRGGNVSCHWARYRAQEEARLDYAFAREGISPFLLTLFEAVVLEGLALNEAGGQMWERLARSQRSGRLSSAFRLAANQLHGRIAHMLAVE